MIFTFLKHKAIVANNYKLAAAYHSFIFDEIDRTRSGFWWHQWHQAAAELAEIR